MAIKRSHLFLKVVLEHDAGDDPQRLAREICRQILKWHGVRDVEVASVTPTDD